MTASTTSLIFLAIAANALASLFLKQYSMTIQNVPITELTIKNFGLVSMAVLFYVVAFIVYAMVLRTLPVSKAYTLITFGAQVTLIVAGFLFLGERIGLLAWAGLTLIFVGLLLVSMSLEIGA